MEKATKALKRGSIRLKSYSEINLILSDLDEIRSHGKSTIKAQQMLIEDLIRWSQHESHESLKNLFSLLTELNLLWNEVHNEYFDNLKKFKNQFEHILESEQTVDRAKANLTECERNEIKAKKRYSSFNPTFQFKEVEDAKEKVKEAAKALDVAKLEEKRNENEIIKLMRVKQGLKRLTESDINLSQKCNIIMQAQKEVINELPDDIEINLEAQYASECKAKQAVARVKTILDCATITEACIPSEYEAPPPYSPFFNLFERNSSRRSYESRPSTSAGSEMPYATISCNWQPNNGIMVHNVGCSRNPKTYVCCKCSAKLISDHRYQRFPDNVNPICSDQLTVGLGNVRIS